MNKHEFLKSVADTTGLSIGQVEKVLATTSGLVKREVAAGNEVGVPGIGKFEVKFRPARKGNSPKGGQIDIAAKNVVGFKPSKEIRDAVPAVSGA